jgi:hypothetical protein
MSVFKDVQHPLWGEGVELIKIVIEIKSVIKNCLMFTLDKDG